MGSRQLDEVTLTVLRELYEFFLCFTRPIVCVLFVVVVVDDGEKGPGAFGFTCSCAKHLTGIIDKVTTKYACNC